MVRKFVISWWCGGTRHKSKQNYGGWNTGISACAMRMGRRLITSSFRDHDLATSPSCHLVNEDSLRKHYQTQTPNVFEELPQGYSLVSPRLQPNNQGQTVKPNNQGCNPTRLQQKKTGKKKSANTARATWLSATWKQTRPRNSRRQPKVSKDMTAPTTWKGQAHGKDS